MCWLQPEDSLKIFNREDEYNMPALGVLCCFALFVCLTLLASFFLPSHLSFKNMYIYSAQYEERELVTISVFSHFLGH